MVTNSLGTAIQGTFSLVPSSNIASTMTQKGYSYKFEAQPIDVNALNNAVLYAGKTPAQIGAMLTDCTNIKNEFLTNLHVAHPSEVFTVEYVEAGYESIGVDLFTGNVNVKGYYTKIHMTDHTGQLSLGEILAIFLGISILVGVIIASYEISQGIAKNIPPITGIIVIGIIGMLAVMLLIGGRAGFNLSGSGLSGGVQSITTKRG